MLAAPAAYPFPAGSVFVDGHALPALVVFDLDYTLWPFWVDTHVTPPLRAAVSASSDTSNTSRSAAIEATNTPADPSTFAPARVVDGCGDEFAFYGDVPHVLQALPMAGIRLGVASRTSAPELVRQMLELLRVPGDRPGVPSGGNVSSKVSNEDGEAGAAGSKAAVAALHAFETLEIYPADKRRHMAALQRRTGVAYVDMLFFDDERRNRNVETLGITMYLVRDGVTWGAVERGVRAWRRRHGHAGGADTGRRTRKKPTSSAWESEDDDYEYEY